MAESSKGGYSYPNPGRLFWHRLRGHWKETVAVVRSVADWTVLLYMLIPGALLGGRLYYGLWKEPLPEWSNHLVYGAIPLFMVLFISAGKLFLMVREGDVLFIQQHKRWLHGLMLGGSLYSMTATAVKIGVGFVLVLPFLVRKLDVSPVAAGCWLLFSITAAAMIVWLKHFARVKAAGWRRFWLYLPMVWLPGAAYVILSVLWRDEPALLAGTGVFLAVMNAALLMLRMRLRGTFMNDVQEELVQRTKLTGLVLSQAVDKPRKIRAKPWVFRRSQHVFRSRTPVHRLAGAALKAYLRYPKQLLGYAQFTSISTVILLTLPAGIQILIYLILHIMLAYWLYLTGNSFMKEGFVTMLPWGEGMEAQAVKLAVRLTLLPFALITAGILVFSLMPIWMAAIAILPLAVLMCGFAVIVLQFLTLRRR